MCRNNGGFSVGLDFGDTSSFVGLSLSLEVNHHLKKWWFFLEDDKHPLK